MKTLNYILIVILLAATAIHAKDNDCIKTVNKLLKREASQKATLKTEKRYLKILKSIDSCLKKNPDNESLLTAKCETLKNLKRYRELISVMSKRAKLKPKDSDIRIHLGMYYDFLKDKKNADIYFRQAYKLHANELKKFDKNSQSYFYLLFNQHLVAKLLNHKKTSAFYNSVVKNPHYKNENELQAAVKKIKNSSRKELVNCTLFGKCK